MDIQMLLAYPDQAARWRRARAETELLAAKGVDARVINVSTISPLDEATIVAAAVETGLMVTAEEATTTGGLGAAVGEVVLRTHPVPTRMLGVPRVFAPTGNNDYLLESFGLTAADIADAVLDLRSKWS